MSRIIIIEDDNLLNNTLQFNLKMEGYEVFSCYSVSDAEKHITTFCADLLIMDVNLGDGNGFELLKKYKGYWKIPCIFLTANDMESDMLKGYELGAEDYVTKPFSIPVLLKKCKVILKRFEQKETADCYNDGYLSADFQTMAVSLGNEKISLTPLEIRMLKIFVSSKNQVLTRNILMDKLWDSSGNYVDEHTLTTNIGRLRNKIENETHKYIKTIYGMGYMWTGQQ